ncbi:MAG: hypothetical protein PHG66_04655 [Candidatus Colwellbacteria bacterium]|nr:hypothetical protein [Candidatus Colwellbacteria bacterium]
MSCSVNRKCNKKIWIEDICALFDNTDLFPTKIMARNEKVNSITRLVLVIFIVMLVLKYKFSLNFLCLSIIIILILYFLTVKEYYGDMDQPPVYKNPLTGQNSQSMKKLMAQQPIIVPRAHDRDVWSFPSYRHSAINYNAAGYDISEEYTSVPQEDSYKEFDPRMESYTNFNLDRLGNVCMNGQNNIPSSNPNLAPRSAAAGNLDRTRPSYLDQGQYQGIPTSQESQYSLDGMTDLGPSQSSQPPSQSVREGFSNTRQKFHNENFNKNQRPMRRENFVTPIQNVISNQPQQRMAQNQPSRRQQQVYSDYSVMGDQESALPLLPNQDLLIPRTITSIYGPGAVSNEERTKYLENIEPTQYSYSDVAYPINSNLGISYTPDIPPMVLDQVATPQGTYPLFHRIDPQLIRAQGISPERREELPYRNEWSARYSGFDAAPGTVNFEDVYDPKFTGYGDEYRSYGDVNLGQIQYFYSDIDAYRSPNFGIRSKVDHIDYVDPMGKVLPEYARSVGVNDIKQSVHDQYNSDALYFREGLQERLMKKRNQELWQLRAMPMRKGANAGTFTSNY